MVINLNVECYNPNIDSNWIKRLFHTLSANSTVYFVNFRQSDYIPILCFTIDYRHVLVLLNSYTVNSTFNNNTACSTLSPNIVSTNVSCYTVCCVHMCKYACKPCIHNMCTVQLISNFMLASTESRISVCFSCALC